MLEPKSSSLSPKMTFIMGLLGGVAVISTIGFFVLLPKALGNNPGDRVTALNNQPPAPAAPTANNPQPTNYAPVPEITAADYIRGDKNAAITLIEYSDFECPFCLRHAPTVERIMSEYQGKVKLVYRHFPLSSHPQAQKAAEAFECAGEQGKAYEMHDKIFEANQNGTMGIEMWKSIAKDLKLNTAKFNDCLDTGKYIGKISEQTTGGAAAGVNGTPATFVNGRLISGAVPYEQFKQIIDSL